MRRAWLDDAGPAQRSRRPALLTKPYLSLVAETLEQRASAGVAHEHQPRGITGRLADLDDALTPIDQRRAWDRAPGRRGQQTPRSFAGGHDRAVALGHGRVSARRIRRVSASPSRP